MATCACGVSNEELPPWALAGRTFRPVGDVQLLPERVPIEVRETGLVPDSKVEWGVKVALAESGLDVSRVQVSVRKQIVTLRGMAAGSQIEAIERTVAGAPTVAGVRNELEVSP